MSRCLEHCCDSLDDLCWVSRCWKKRDRRAFKEALEDVGPDWIDRMMEKWWWWGGGADQ